MINVKDQVNSWGSAVVRDKLFAQLDKTYTYGQLHTAVTNCARYLRSKGLHKGERIIIATRQPYALAAVFWACLYEGITAVLLDPDIGPERAGELMEITDCQFMVVDDTVSERWKLAERSVPFITTGTPVKKKSRLLSKMLRKKQASESTDGTPSFWKSVITFQGDYPETAAAEEADTAYILFTSGSTSTPKAVQISYRALWSNLATIKKVYALDNDSRIFNILTVYHTDGVIQGPVLAGYLNAGWYHPFDFSVDRLPLLFDSFYKYQITHFITVPTLLRLMYDLGEAYVDCFEYPEFKYVITSAAPFEPQLWQAFEERFSVRVINNYGLTETVAGASYCGPAEDSFRLGSIGIPIDCEFKVVDTSGNPLPPGEEGELLIKGDNVLTSYLNNPAANEACFSGVWFRTGDTAYQDADGFYFLKGRIKNLIISGGINIQPEEVISVLNKHTDVAEAACVGIPDDIFGELPVAAVVLQRNAAATSVELIEHCREELEEIKIPKVIHIVKELPKTASGKIKYARLKQQVLDGVLSTAQSTTASTGNRATILEAANVAFKVKLSESDFDGASTLTLDGWDSLAHLSFITELEEKLSLRFSSKEIMQITSLRETEHILANKGLQ